MANIDLGQAELLLTFPARLALSGLSRQPTPISGGAWLAHPCPDGLGFGRVVTCYRYRREIGKVLVGGLDANLEQVKRGMAWHYKAYAKEQPPDLAPEKRIPC